MRINSRKVVGSALATAGVIAGLGVSLTGSATADEAARGGGGNTVTVKAAVKDGKLDFYGPRSVESGEKLTVLNATKPGRIGPHTFSLVRKSDLKGCAACGNIARAHEAGPGGVGRPDVDVRQTGWDKSFGKRGDTFYSETKGETEKRKVSAEAGRKLFFFCAIHPFMRKRINVN